MTTQQPPPNLGEYSPSATLIPFNRPIPLLRGPVKASPLDDPESGPFVLAFNDQKSWAAAYMACESQITQQCEAGARIGCSLTASNKCKPPLWKTLVGLAKHDYAERAKCEEREMEACFEAAKEKCNEFARQKCLTAFGDARIAVKSLDLMTNRREVAKLISWVCLGSKSSGVIEILKFGKPWAEFQSQFEVTNCRGSDLLGSSSVDSIDDFAADTIKKR